jgi:DNA polymerase-1
MGNAVDVLGPPEVCEKWDIERVDQVIDMLGLQGDASDNIPGIPGVGPKTASALLKQFGSVENIIAHANELKGRQKELVHQYADQALLSKKLATIMTEVPLTVGWDELAYTGPDEEQLKPLFQELEFKTFLSRLFNTNESIPVKPGGAQLSMFGGQSPAPAGTPAAPDPAVALTTFASATSSATSVTSVQELSRLVKTLLKAPALAIDVVQDEQPAVTVALAGSVEHVYVIPMDTEEKWKSLAPLFQSTQLKIGHNLKASLLILHQQGYALAGPFFDTLIAHYLIEPESAHDLSTLSAYYLHHQLQQGMASAPEALRERVSLAMQLQPLLARELETRGHMKLMRDVEMPLMDVLASMEFEGVSIDQSTLATLSEALKNESEKVQDQIFSLAGASFNINSPKQLGELLFEKLKLGDKPKKTKTGQYATGEEVLLKLVDEHEIVKKILDYREYEKLRSTYVDALPKMVSPRDGRIHTDYRQAVAATGRLSSNNPNLQNIPIRTEKGRQIRKAFVPRSKNFLLMSADYSQIELRIAASFAKDQTMIDAFRNKRDIHATTAAKVFKVPLDKVTPDMRRKAKEVNFGILYGSTAFGLSQNLNIARSEAQEIIQSYFREFPAIKNYMDQVIEKARQQEYVETILGRRRYLRDINSRNIATRGFAERNAINAPIQGSAADIIKIAMVNIYRWLNLENLKTRMIMQVHDELVFDLHQNEVDIVKENVVNLMKHAVQLDVPMEVEVGIGKNWLEAH